MVKTKVKKLNPQDKKLATLISRVIDEKTKTVLATKDDLKQFATKDDLKKAVSYLPTKEELYQKMDEVMGELSDVRDEITILADMKRQVNDHEDRLETIEEKLNISLLV